MSTKETIIKAPRDAQIMPVTKLQKATTSKPAAKKAPAQPQRVELVNMDKRNGPVGQIARPFEKDAAAWLGKGWQRKSAGNAD